MIVSKTPYRISFFGGGTDYSSWYSKNGGAVFSTTISHYCYISARYRPPFFPDKSRIVWNRIEEVMDHADIHHPSVRETLKYLGIEEGVEIHHSGDLPARSGMGSSSVFTVGLLNALAALQGRRFNKAGLALESVHLERDVLKENVGIQDQIAAAYGGLNHTQIFEDGSYIISPVQTLRQQELEDHCLLFYTGVSRTASDIAAEQTKNTAFGTNDAGLHTMRALVDEAMGILAGSGTMEYFGQLLHESWSIKRGLAKNISPDFVDKIYTRARNWGAWGGKLLGAGGGGFMLFLAPPDAHNAVREALKDLLWVPFKFEDAGSQIIFNQPNNYSRESLARRDYVVQR